MSSIADQLASLTNPKPSFDPEDDIHEETRAKLIGKELLQNENGLATAPEQSIGKSALFRMHNDDPRYTGKVISRKDVESDAEFSDNEDLYNDLISSDAEDNESLDDSGSDDDDEEKDDNIDDDDEEIDSDDAMGSSDEEKYAPFVFQKQKLEGSEESKGKDTVNQINLWESILETRIKLQKLLTLANQLPRPSLFQKFVDQSDASASIDEATNSLTALGSAMFQLQGHLLKQLNENSEMEESDETSSTLDTGCAFDKEGWNEKISKRCNHLRKRRNNTLKFWYDKTRLTAGKVNDKSFSSFERPTVAQIEHILADRDRLIRRTKLRRSNYRVLGSTETKDETDTDAVHDAHLNETDEEVFDDDDFYQQLLRQFIEQKTSRGGDETPVEMTRNWLKLQHLKAKTRKIVDTKASKGRKVRYDVHSKLVSFMAPADKSSWNHESRNQLVKSLFGKSMICYNGAEEK